jgi:hypothetical protein
MGKQPRWRRYDAFGDHEIAALDGVIVVAAGEELISQLRQNTARNTRNANHSAVRMKTDRGREPLQAGRPAKATMPRPATARKLPGSVS